MSGGVSVGTPPATPLSLTSLCQIASSSGGRTEYSPPLALAGLLLRYDFAVRSEAVGCSCARLPAGLASRGGSPPLASTRRAHLILIP